MPRHTAWAIEVEPENYQVILSEGGRQINREFLDTWVRKYPDEASYFVRDEERKRFDCTLMTADNFWTLYRRVDQVVCNPETLNDGLVECNGAHFFPIESEEVTDHAKLLAS